MGTSLGTYLGTRLGTELGTGSDESSELALLELYLSKNLFSWMRADYRTEAASKVTAFQDKVLLPVQGGLAGNARSIDPNHAFAQATGANQVAAITTSATWGGREAAAFAAAQLYQSTVAGSGWAFTADGTGFGGWCFFSQSSTAGTGVLYGSTSSGNSQGVSAYVAAGVPRRGVYNAGAVTVVADGAYGAITANTPYMSTIFHATSRSPQFSAKVSGQAAVDVSYTNAASAGAASQAMILGANVGPAVGFSGLMAEAAFSKGVPSATLIANYARYALLRYGTAL